MQTYNATRWHAKRDQSPGKDLLFLFWLGTLMVLESEQEKIGCYLLRIVALLLGYHHFIYYLYDNQAFVVMHGNALLGLNTWCSANSIGFKSHSISVTFKFCAVRVALCSLEPRSTDSLGTQHRAKFESNTNRMTFEYAPNMMIVKIHPRSYHMI